MVDRSLETLAVDRGVTICFADLDGVDGLWLPDERTILINSRLGTRRAVEVLDHELTHVDIEDGHRALDAAARRPGGRTRIAVGSVAAATLVLLLAVRSEFSGSPTSDTHQAPPPQAGLTTAPPQTDQQRPPDPGSAAPSTKMVTQVYDGGVRTRTVTVSPSARPASAAPRSSLTATSTAASAPNSPGRTPTPTASSTPTTSVSPSPTATGTSSPTPSVPAATTVQRPRANNPT